MTDDTANTHDVARKTTVLLHAPVHAKLDEVQRYLQKCKTQFAAARLEEPLSGKPPLRVRQLLYWTEEDYVPAALIATAEADDQLAALKYKQHNSKLDRENEMNYHKRLAICADAQNNIFDMVTTSAEKHHPHLVTKMMNVCRTEEYGVAYNDGTRAWNMLMHALLHPFDEVGRTAQDKRHYDIADDMITNADLPKGTSATTFGDVAHTWAEKIMPNVPRKYDPEDAALRIVNLMPVSNDEKSRIEDEILREGTYDLDHIISRCKRVVHRHEQAGVNIPTLQLPYGCTARAEEFTYLATSCGLVIQNIAALSTTQTNKGGMEKKKWCKNCPHIIRFGPRKGEEVDCYANPDNTDPVNPGVYHNQELFDYYTAQKKKNAAEGGKPFDPLKPPNVAMQRAYDLHQKAREKPTKDDKDTAAGAFMEDLLDIDEHNFDGIGGMALCDGHDNILIDGSENDMSKERQDLDNNLEEAQRRYRHQCHSA